MSKEIIVDWITDPNSCFLIGTGCSACVSKPLLAELTKKVIETVDAKTKKVFESIEGENGRKATIEDLMNYFLQMNKLLNSRKEKKEKDWTTTEINKTLGNISQVIVEKIGGEWKSSAVHEKFFRRLASNTERRTCDIFSLNYDVILEATLETLKYSYTDGFRGAENAYFDPSIFSIEPRNDTYFRVYKLHGSINWVRDETETVRRRPYKKDDKQERLVIYPSEQKYVQTQFGIYETLINQFRSRLKNQNPNNKLVVMGYSMSDEHINEAIMDAVCSPDSNMTVYAFVGVEKDLTAQITRLKKYVERAKDKINIMIGDKEYLGMALEKDEWEKIKSSNYWKFENIVELLSEGGK